MQSKGIGCKGMGDLRSEIPRIQDKILEAIKSRIQRNFNTRKKDLMSSM